MPMPIEKLWLDCLHGKHECFEQGHLVTKPIEVDGVQLKLLLPDYRGAFTVLHAAQADELLYVVGANDEESFDDKPPGVFVIARRLEGDTFAAHVWHEMYPYVFKHLGLSAPERTAPDNHN